MMSDAESNASSVTEDTSSQSQDSFDNGFKPTIVGIRSNGEELPPLTDIRAWLWDIKNENANDNAIIGIIFFRGSWCPYCRQYLSSFNDLYKSKMFTANCKIYAFTSDDVDQIEHAQNFYNWDLSAFEGIYSDKHNLFARYMQGSGYLPDLQITNPDRVRLYRNVTSATFPYGVCQPALLFFVGTDVALRWSSKPGPSNYYGAKDRPVPKSVWEEVVSRRRKLRNPKFTRYLEPSDASHLPKVTKYTHSWLGKLSSRFVYC